MKPEIKIVLLAEDRYSIGRIMAIGGISLILITFFVFNLPDILIGDVTQDWNTNGGLYILGYGLSILLIVSGLVAHHMAKWPEFVEEVYPDGWIRYRVRYGNNVSFESGVPSNLIVRISKYKKRYSRRREMWYIRLNFDILYGNRAYTAVSYGWLKEPEDIKEFERYVNYIKEQIKGNTKGRPIKMTFSTSGYSLDSWNELEYAKKLKEQWKKLIEGE